MEFDADVLVLGAGMAGLTVARALGERGVKVLVLEAREQVGGRIMTHELEGGQTVELGAEFVHGRAPELWALIEECGASTVERDGAMLREEQPGVLAEEDDDEDDVFAPLEQLEDVSGTDESFAAWLEKSDVPEWQRPVLTGYVEGFNAADARLIGIHALGVQQKAEDEIEGDRTWHVQSGYRALPLYLRGKVAESGGEIRLGCAVTALRWQAGSVEVETAQGETLRAPRCVVTLPLGVLQKVNRSGGVRMEPEPRSLVHARRLAMGQVVRFTMVFRAAWWLQSKAADHEALEKMSFLFTLAGTPSVWWTARPEQQRFPTLTGWAGGPRSEALRGKTAEQLGSEAGAALAAVFGVEEQIVREALVETLMHDWTADPNFCGAYSYAPAGAVDASRAMTEPEAGTLFFAGEHTDVTGNWGTVHAAIRSGLRAAQQVLDESA